MRKTPLFPKPLAKSAIVVYNQVRNRRILACPTVAQSETYKALSLLTDYRLSPIGVEDSLSVYLRLCLLSMYVKAANTTNKSVSTSKVSIPTSFPSPERTTARLSLLALIWLKILYHFVSNNTSTTYDISSVYFLCRFQYHPGKFLIAHVLELS